VIKEVNLCYVPDAKVDDYVVVHVGFALNVLDEEEAQKVFEYLREMEELGDVTGETE
jgi:hydrogenase expression/formation protein HypC